MARNGSGTCAVFGGIWVSKNCKKSGPLSWRATRPGGISGKTLATFTPRSAKIAVRSMLRVGFPNACSAFKSNGTGTTAFGANCTRTATMLSTILETMFCTMLLARVAAKLSNKNVFPTGATCWFAYPYCGTELAEPIIQMAATKAMKHFIFLKEIKRFCAMKSSDSIFGYIWFRSLFIRGLNVRNFVIQSVFTISSDTIFSIPRVLVLEITIYSTILLY